MKKIYLYFFMKKYHIFENKKIKNSIYFILNFHSKIIELIKTLIYFFKELLIKRVIIKNFQY